jgi:hypothetical protein
MCLNVFFMYLNLFLMYFNVLLMWDERREEASAPKGAMQEKRLEKGKWGMDGGRGTKGERGKEEKGGCREWERER